jgi:phage anti-repressor protein
MVIDGLWLHTVWHANSDETYLESAHRYAAMFPQRYAERKDKLFFEAEEDYTCAYHYVELGLMKWLDYALDQHLPVKVYW